MAVPAMFLDWLQAPCPTPADFFSAPRIPTHNNKNKNQAGAMFHVKHCVAAPLESSLQAAVAAG
jgi:hypothetical protein